MVKALPILGIVGAVFGALAIAVLVPDSLAMFAPLLVGFAGSVALVGQRNIRGAVVGLLVLLLTVVAALGLVGNVSTEGGGETNFGIGVALGQVLAVAACLALPLAAIGLRWADAQPRWLTLAGGACAGLALLLVALDPDGIAQQNQADTLLAAVLALLSGVAMVPLLRADAGRGEPAPLASAETAVPTSRKGPSPPGRHP